MSQTGSIDYSDARASTRFYNRLLNHPTVGPVILDWRRHRSMKAGTKRIAIGAALVAFIARIPTRG